MSRLRASELLAVLSTLALLSCRELQPIPTPEQPQVTLTSAAAHFPDANHGEFDVTLAVEDREGRMGIIESISWEIWLKNRWFAAGTQALTAPLPASGVATVSLKLPVAFRDVPVSTDRTRFDLGVRGSLSASYSGTSVRIPFAVAKRIEAIGVPILESHGEE
jgi:hypothetical protein